MHIMPVNRNNYDSQTSFKHLIIKRSAKNVIKNFSEAENLKFNELAKRIENTKYWDLKIEQLAHDNEFYFNFYKKNFLFNRNFYTGMVHPFKVENNVLYVYGGRPYADIDEDNDDILIFPSAQRAQEIYDNDAKRTKDLYGTYKYQSLTPLDELEYAVSAIEYMEESYSYMSNIGALDSRFNKKAIKIFEHQGNTEVMLPRFSEAKTQVEMNKFENNTKIQKARKKNGKITFADVGGQENAIDILKKKVLFPIKYPQAFKNRTLNHGIILYGIPGTGKSLIALALSNEADASFIKINASNLTSSLHGQTEQNWRELFAKAKRQQPCIVFVDEIDTVMQKRGHNAMNNYDDVTLNQILAEMSDLEKSGDLVFIVGATNRFNELDDAAKRSGRFGTHIEIAPPKNIEEISQIFDIHTADKVLDSDVNKSDIAKLLLDKKATGADIASVANEALENSFIRNGIYSKMEGGTFKNSDLDNVKISTEDFILAIEALKKS